MKILEHWVRPWRGELVVGQVVAISGSSAVCQTANGFEFRVGLEDIAAGRAEVFTPAQYVAKIHRRSNGAYPGRKYHEFVQRTVEKLLS